MVTGPVCFDAIHRKDTVDEVVRHIEKCLLDPDWLNNNHCSGENGTSLTIILNMTLYRSEKAAINELYRNALWDDVTIRNSGENGERPGLCSITLFTKRLFT